MGGSGEGGGAVPLPLPRAPPLACPLLPLSIHPTASLALTVEVGAPAAGGGGGDGGGGGGAAWCSLALSRAPLFVKGRYLKLLRGLSQTPWFLNGARRELGGSEAGGEGDGLRDPPADAAAAPAPLTSVEELLGAPIAEVLAAYGGAGVAEGLFSPPSGEPGEGGGGGVSGHSPAAAPPLLPAPAAPPPSTLLHAPLFTFHAAGREDVDVRMLGTGRPFAIELNACRPVLLPLAELRRMGARINSGEGVRARALRPAGRAEFAALAAGADRTRKEYAARGWSEAPFASQGALVGSLRAGGGLGGAPGSGAPPLPLAQRTPIRVLHRRSLLTRAKALLGGRALRLGEHFFLLHLTTSAGTYVKEFVHGDFGRTRPSLSEVLGGGGHCDILALDVVGHASGGGGGEGEEAGAGEEEGE